MNCLESQHYFPDCGRHWEYFTNCKQPECEGIWGQHILMLRLSPNSRETNGETPKYNTPMLGPLNITGTNTTSLPLPPKYNTDWWWSPQIQCWIPLTQHRPMPNQAMQHRPMLSYSNTTKTSAELNTDWCWALKHNTDRWQSPQTQHRPMLNPLNTTQTNVKLISTRQINAEPLQHNTDQCQTP